MRRTALTPLSLALLAVLAAVTFLPRPAESTLGTVIVLEGSGVGDVGATGTVSVVVSLAPEDTLSSFEVDVSFDPSIAEVFDADSIELAPRWGPPSGVAEVIDAGTPGLVHVRASTSDPCAAGSQCALFSFSWEALSQGTTSMSVSGFALAGSESGTPGSLSAVGAGTLDVTVGQAAPTPPTATPTPTQTASPTATPTATPTPAQATGTPTSAAPTTPTAPAPQTSTAIAGVSPTGAAAPTPVDGVISPAAPRSGGGLLASPGGQEFAQAAMMVLLVAALLAFGWITTSLRTPATAVSNTRAPRRERAQQAIDEYLSLMEALGMASSDIELPDDKAGDEPLRPPAD